MAVTLVQQHCDVGSTAIHEQQVAKAHSPDAIQHDTICVTPTVPKSNALRGLSDIAHHQNGDLVTEGGFFRSSNWMISVSSVMAEGGDAVASAGETKERFVVIVSGQSEALFDRFAFVDVCSRRTGP